MAAKTPTNLPKGKTMAYYDNPRPSMRGKASKAPPDMREAMGKVFSGEHVIKVPEGRKQKKFITRIREYLARRDRNVRISKIGSDEVYVRLGE